MLRFPPGDRGKHDAVEAAVIVGMFDFGKSAGSLSSPGNSRTWCCISHKSCLKRVKVLFAGNHADEGFQLFESIGDHAHERIPLPKGFKGISAEFSSEVDVLLGKGLKPLRVLSELTISCSADDGKKLRLPSRKKITARKTALFDSSKFQFQTNADMMLFCNSRLVRSQVEFDAIEDIDSLIVYSTFCEVVEVKDETEGAPLGSMVSATTLGFNFGSKRTALQLKRVFWILCLFYYSFIKCAKFFQGNVR